MTVLICSAVSLRSRITPPVLLLGCGALLGFVPTLRTVTLPPEAVLLLFLPALLYWESLTTSLREIRSNLRVIVLASTALVIVTAGIVAVVAHRLGLPWGPAWVLGAAVAPTDATAVGVLARNLPRRIVTVLRAESLVNDGTALVIYGLAVGVTVGEEHLGVGHVGWLFLLAYVGGALAGCAVAWLTLQARRFLDDPVHENVVSVLTPFVAFLVAELIHASGVLAVVVCGLILSQTGPRIVRADTRQQAQAFWGLSTFLLNGSLFVLVGLQLQSSVRDLTSFDLTRALGAVGLISAAVIGTRFAWTFTVTYLIRAIDRRPQQRSRRVGARTRVVNASAGFRGAVSMAAALAVPETIGDGGPFPDRDIIIFVTSGVIVVTLVLQGLLLPLVIRWARLPYDSSVEEERLMAEITATSEALEVIPGVAADLGIDEAVVSRTLAEYDTHLRILRARQDGTEPEEEINHTEHDYATLRLELLSRKRASVIRLRDERQIDDTVLRQIQARLDIEELRLTRRDTVD
jgi:CPA1 family monovalent cation:H+ antiporter